MDKESQRVGRDEKRQQKLQSENQIHTDVEEKMHRKVFKVKIMAENHILRRNKKKQQA